jgi:hypothetical protein
MHTHANLVHFNVYPSLFLLYTAGTVCLTYPPVTLNPVMDHTEAISLDRIHDIYQSTSARLSIETGEIGSTGPIVLVQDTAYEKGQESHESLIFWTPIYDEQFDLVTNDGVVYQDYWGFAGVLLDWYNVMREVGLYEFFEERDMRFALVEVLDDGTEKVVEATVDDQPVLTRETAALALPLQARDDWVLLVDVPPPTVGDPAFAIWGSFLVIIASFLLSLALMQILVSRKDHEELLCRCIPRNIVRRLHAGETVIEKYDMATICFIDIVSFTTMSGRMKAHEVMEMLQVSHVSDFVSASSTSHPHVVTNTIFPFTRFFSGSWIVWPRSTTASIAKLLVMPILPYPVAQREMIAPRELPISLHLPLMQLKL